MELESRGFTFVEILIALCLLSIALLGIVGMSSTGAEEMMGAEKRLISLQTAKNRMERLLNSGEPSSGDEDLPGGIRCVWQILKDVPAPGLDTVTVRVSWPRKSGEQEMILQRMVYR